jgi:hypothetical protein
MSETSTVKVGQFSGNLSSFMRNAYGDLVCFGLPKRVAHTVASDFGSDLGKAMQTDGKLNAKVQKAKEDGESGFKLSGKTGSYYQTPAMSIVRVAQQLDALKKEKLIENGNVLMWFAYTNGVESYVTPLLEAETKLVAAEKAEAEKQEALTKAAKAEKKIAAEKEVGEPASK